MLAWIVVEIASDLRGAQQSFNSLGFVEAFIDAKPDVGRKLEVHPASDFAAKIALVAIERGEHDRSILAAERQYVDGCHP